MPEDVNGLPDVKGLEAFVRSSSPDIGQDKGQVASPVPQQQNAQQPEQSPVQTPQQDKPAGEIDLAQFKNPKDMLKSYKEIQGAFTSVSQENKSLRDTVDQMREQMELINLQMQGRPPMQAQQHQTAGNDFDETFIQNPRQAVEVLAERKAGEKIMQARVIEALEEEQLVKPEDFPERYAYVQQLSRQYPALVTSKPGVKKLFQMADKIREQDVKKNAARAVNQLFGAGAMEQLSAILAKQAGTNQNNPNLAYMPDAGGTIGNRGSDAPNTNYDAKIQEAVGKGDIDGVLNNLFQRQMRTP